MKKNNFVNLKKLSQNIKISRDEIQRYIQYLYLEHDKVSVYEEGLKASTIINWAELSNPTISYVVDNDVYKKGKYISNTNIQIFSPKKNFSETGSYAIINLALDHTNEISRSLQIGSKNKINFYNVFDGLTEWM